jgi:PAS domain S-box-containing protein
MRERKRRLDNPYEAVVEHCMDAIFLTRPDGPILFANRAACELFQMTKEELVQGGRSAIMDAGDPRLGPALAQRERTGRYVGELRCKKADGTVFPALVSSVLFSGSDGPTRSSIIIRDLTEQRRMEAALWESEERFIGAFTHAPIGIALVSPLGRWLKVNRSLCDLLGYSEKELFERTFQDITHPEDLEPDTTMVARMLAGEISTYQMEKRYIHKQGHAIWALLDVSLVRDENSRPAYFISQIVDISELKRFEDALRKQGNEYRALVEGLPDVVFRLDGAGRYLFASENIAEITGLSVDRCLGKTHRELGLPESVCRFWDRSLPQVIQSGLPLEDEIRLPGGQGEVILNCRLIPELHEAGRVESVLIIARDVTAHRRMEQDYRTLFHKMLDGFALHDIVLDADGRSVDYRFLAVNPAFESLTGLKAERVVGRTVLEVLPRTEPYWIEAFGRVARSGEPVTFDAYAGELGRHFKVTAFSPNAGQFAAIFQDTTREKVSEEQNRRNMAWLKAMVEILQYRPRDVQDFLDHALDQAVSLSRSRCGYVYFYDDERREFTFNTRSGDPAPGCPLSEPPIVCALDHGGAWGEAVRSGRPVAVNGIPSGYQPEMGRSGGPLPLTRLLAIPVICGDRAVAVVGVADKESDYTETDQLELTLLMDAVWKSVENIRSQDALSRLEWLLTTRPANGDGGVHQPSYGSLAALNDHGLIRRSVDEDLLRDIASDFLDLLETSAAIYEKNGDYALGLLSSGWCRLMDGASRTLCGTDDNREALACGRWLCHESCWTQNAKKAMETGKPVEIACNGGIRMYGVPIRAGGEIVGAINFGFGDPPRDPVRLGELADRYGVDRDALRLAAEAYETRPPFIIELAKKRLAVSARLIGEIVERKQAEAEKERLQGQLLQAQKMESVGRLAGGVAHDFNNMLNVIMGQSELALDQVGPGDPVREALKEIFDAGRRSAEITRQLLAFARRQTISPRIIDLNETVAGMLKMLRRLIGEDIDLSWEPGAGLWPMNMDPAQIHQVLANLLVNARDAIDGVGRITIRTGNMAAGQPDRRGRSGPETGDHVLLTVSDNGCGMSRETLENLFEPFFTTKDVGRGTGLGLATVYGIVRQNGGFIDVESDPGRGSIFRIWLPRHVGNQCESEDPAPAVLPSGRGETILMVEDESALLKLARKTLTGLGYRVLAAAHPGAALETAAEQAGGIDLLVVDVIMPGMNGRELAERLKARHPGMGILYMSGYTADVIAPHGILDQGIHFLQKPFSREDLARKVREALPEG